MIKKNTIMSKDLRVDDKPNFIKNRREREKKNVPKTRAFQRSNNNSLVISKFVK